MEFCAEVYVLEIEVDYEITQACPDNGSITLYPSEGQEPYNYIWDDGSTDQIKSNLNAGKHYATVTDINGCKKEISLELTEEPAINLDDMEYTIDHALCHNNPNLVKKGFINIYQPPSGGTQPFTYTWSHGTTGTFINNLVAGTYTVDISDAAGCVVSKDFEIEEKGLPIIEDVDIINTCSGSSTGFIYIDGLYTTYDYKWSTGSTDSYIADLPAGTYSVTITDGCSIERTYEIINDESGEFAVTSISSENSCIGENTGSVSLTYENNVGRVYAFWDDGDVHSTSLSTITRNNMSAGSYTVTLEDECGREVTESYVVEDNTLDYYIDMEPSCYGNTILTLNIVNGLYHPYTYSWSGGETESQIEARSELDLSNSDQWNYNDTYYSLTITDGSGCEYITSDILLEHIEYTVEDVLPSCEGFDDGEFKVIIDNEDLNFSAFMDDMPIWFSNSDGQLEHHASNLAPGTYRVVLEFDNCNLGFSVTIEDSIERIYDDHIEGDEDDEDDLGTCIYQLACKGVIISEEEITQDAYIDYSSATDNSDNVIQSGIVNVSSILGIFSPWSWVTNQIALDVSGKCGYDIVCGDEVVGFKDLGNTKISGAAYDAVLDAALASGALDAASIQAGHVSVYDNRGKIAPCQDIFYCEATFEIMGYEDAIGWADSVPMQISEDCYKVVCDGFDEIYCLDDIVPPYLSDAPNFDSSCKPRRIRIIHLLEHLDKIKDEFGVSKPHGLIPLLEELSIDGLMHGCGYVLFCEEDFRVIKVDIQDEPCIDIDKETLAMYENNGWTMPDTYCDYVTDENDVEAFICEGTVLFEFVFDTGYPFGLKNNDETTTRNIRKVKSGDQKNGLSFSNFSNKRNIKFSFPQIMSYHMDSPFKIYIDEKSNKNNLATDNQDMNFDLDVISGSYKVNEAESHILYRASDNSKHFTLSASEKVNVQGVDNSEEGQLEYFGTYSGTLSEGSQSIKNDSHFMGVWTDRNRGELFSIPNSNENSTKFYCSSKGNFAVNTSDNMVETFKISDSQLIRNRIELEDNERSMNIEFVTDNQLVLMSANNNDLNIKSISTDQNKKSTYALSGDYEITNTTVSQNDFFTDISVSFRGQLQIEGNNLRNGSTNSSFAILRFDPDFQLVSYYFDAELTCDVTVQEMITYENNHIAIGGDFLSSGLINKIGDSEYYNSGINISTPFKAIIYDEFFTTKVESRNIDQTKNGSISLFPNPTNAKVSILSGSENMNTISVYNTSGQTLLSVKNINESQFNLDVTSLKPGIYFLEIDLFETSETMKLIIIE